MDAILTFSQNFLTQLSTDKQVWLWVKERLLAQMSKSIDDQNTCVYKSDTGLKCAVGHLIDPVFYNSTVEHKTVYDSDVQEIVRQSIPYWDLDEDLLNRLQKIHDGYDPKDWERVFDTFNFDENDNYILSERELWQKEREDAPL